MTEQNPRLVRVYDELNSGTWDTDFYAAQLSAEPLRVADIGCGTGAFAVRLARLGHQVVGVDPSSAMLDFARRREGAELVHWLDGTAESLPSGPFDAALMMGHAFQCLLSDEAILATLRAVRSRLAPGGRFMFESRNPVAKAWLGWNTPENQPSRTETASEGPLEESYRVLSAKNELVDFECWNKFLSDDEEITERATLRFAPASTLDTLLAAAGFGAIRWFGDWNGADFDPRSSAEIIVIAAS
ncbi:ubiquinone/menaquinone biosynthesis C-methylase UbiE [Psychromicrobium silvestre]|uniref:Ubiquinone/menaquinone biosynthesis C-methylase UbiE n=1 Tax=Psychromicrobium silvestre TaxID=1645614 RepID=A0A7Y9LSB0_9MICC|nr:class I SAM-dependent methyltransferase [Psychromicrobium silvestre]NYE94679.1 ubiquinone/menaquinone biosynthesis C-methylase UbiE [Psychromicrobium silvestre]